MIHIEEAVIVEGKYDKIKLSNFLDAMIVETGGFAIYKDKKRLQFIRRLAMERGIIILTDSDHSGFQIRNYIAKGLPPQQVKHLYIPDVYGKEHRKQKPAKEGKLGVEGIDDSVLMALFDRLQVRYTTQLPPTASKKRRNSWQHWTCRSSSLLPLYWRISTAVCSGTNS